MQKPIVIFSSDDNLNYSEFFPLVDKLWKKIGFDTFYAKIGSDQFPKISGVESSLQSQISRLYATKLFPDRPVLITDIDMLPLDQNYFLSKIAKADDEIVIYSFDAHGGKRYPMCYLSAYGSTFSSIVLENDEETWEDFVLRLNSLGLGWNTDELYITEKINNSEYKKIKYNRGWEYGRAKNRLDRVYWKRENQNYIDAHCPRPYTKYKNEIDELENILNMNYSNIHPFIFNWNGKYENTIEIERSISKCFDRITVINSDDINTKSNWINIGNTCYFSDQFRKALELFDGDILFHIQGDVSYDRWEELIHDARYYMDYYNAGIYAPNVDYTWYSSENTDIDSLESDHPNIKMVACTDETVWFIRKDILSELDNRKIDFSKNKMGWGWDLVLSSICFDMGIPVIRDYNHTIIHPQGTSYDKQVASQEMSDLWNNLDENLKSIISMIKGNKYDREKISKFFN